MTKVRTDGALIEACAAMGSTSTNSATGVGMGRNKSSYNAIGAMRELSIDERIRIVRSSTIARRAVFAYPEAAGAAGWEWSFSGTPRRGVQDKLVSYCDRLELQDALVQASCEARWHGDGYILIGVADGKRLDAPLEKFKSIEQLSVLGGHECYPSAGYSRSRKPIFYDTANHGKIHESRLIRFVGSKLLGYALDLNAGKNDSVLQSLVESLLRHDATVTAAADMVIDFSVFVLAMDGLGELIEKGEKDALYNRMLANRLTMSVSSSIMIDAADKVQFTERNCAGVKDITDVITEKLVSASDMPRANLLGTSNNTGLGSADKGENDRITWEGLRYKWQEVNWRLPLQRIAELIFAADDGPTKGARQSITVNFPTGVEPDKVGEANFRLATVEQLAIADERQWLTKEEIRASLYGGADFNSNIMLITEKAPVPTIALDAMDLQDLAAITDEDLAAARERWEQDPPDRDFDGVLG